MQASVRLPPEFAVADNEGDLPQVVKVRVSFCHSGRGRAGIPYMSNRTAAFVRLLGEFDPIPAIFRNSGWSPRFDSSG